MYAQMDIAPLCRQDRMHTRAASRSDAQRSVQSFTIDHNRFAVPRSEVVSGFSSVRRALIDNANPIPGNPPHTPGNSRCRAILLIAVSHLDSLGLSQPACSTHI